MQQNLFLLINISTITQANIHKKNIAIIVKICEFNKKN